MRAEMCDGWVENRRRDSSTYTTDSSMGELTRYLRSLSMRQHDPRPTPRKDHGCLRSSGGSARNAVCSSMPMTVVDSAQ